MTPFLNRTLHFLVNPGWTIFAHNDSAAECLSGNNEPLIGRNLRSILLAINSDWEGLLPEAVSGSVKLGALLRSGRESSVPDLYLSGIQIPGTSGNTALMIEPCGTFCRKADRRSEKSAESWGFGDLPVRKFLPLLKDRAISYRQSSDLRRTDIRQPQSAFAIEGDDFLAAVHPEDREEFRETIWSCPPDEPVCLRYRLLLPDGSVRHVIDFRRYLSATDGSGDGYDGLLCDLTREVLTDRRLQQAGWQENLYLAMRVLLHDFNNAITGMYVLLESVEDLAEDDEDNREIVAAMQERTDQTAALVRHVERLNQKKIGAPTRCCLGELVREQEAILKKMLPHGARLQIEIDEEPLPARVDAVALQSMLFSFALNARDALGHGGHITLRARKIRLEARPERGITFASAPGSGEGAELLFCDNGCGIEPEALPRIVDPHYSTHARNHGAGLGLFNVQRLAEANGFGFGAFSEPGVGTEMMLVIPLSSNGRDAGESRSSGTRRALVWKSPETDQQPSGESLAAHLEGAGWELRTFGSREEGERILKRSADSWVILFEADSGGAADSARLPPPLLDWLADLAGSALRVLRLRGMDPDGLGTDLRRSFDVVLDGNRGAKEDFAVLMREG